MVDNLNLSFILCKMGFLSNYDSLNKKVIDFEEDDEFMHKNNYQLFWKVFNKFILCFMEERTFQSLFYIKLIGSSKVDYLTGISNILLKTNKYELISDTSKYNFYAADVS